MERLSEINMGRGISCVKTFIGRADVYVHPSLTAKLQCIVSIKIELKNDMPKPLLTQAIAFFATDLLVNYNMKHRTESNAD